MTNRSDRSDCLTHHNDSISTACDTICLGVSLALFPGTVGEDCASDRNRRTGLKDQGQQSGEYGDTG